MFTIIISALTDSKKLPLCLASLTKQTFSEWECYVLQKNTTKQLPKYRGVHYCEVNEDNFAISFNNIVLTAENEIIVFWESCTFLTADCLQEVAAYFKNFPATKFLYPNYWKQSTLWSMQSAGNNRYIPLGYSNLDLDAVRHLTFFRRTEYLRTPLLCKNMQTHVVESLTYIFEELGGLTYFDKCLAYCTKKEDSKRKAESIKIKRDVAERREKNGISFQSYPLVLKTAIEHFKRANTYFERKKFGKAHREIKKYTGIIDYGLFEKCDNRRDDMPEVSVIIVTYHADGRLLENAKELSASKNTEVIIIDNGGNEKYEHEIKQLPLLYVKTPLNVKPSEGKNIGSFFSGSPILVFLDDDGKTQGNYIENVLNVFQNADIIALRGQAIPSQGTLPPKHHYFLGNTRKISLLNLEGNMAILKSAYISIGGMNPLLFGHEGIDLSLRLLNKGFKLSQMLYIPEVKIIHDYQREEQREQKKKSRHRMVHNYMRWKYAFYSYQLKRIKKEL